MKGRDIFDLVLLGALWGGSFIFMRIASPEFGPVPLVAIRIAVAAACLVPLLRVGGRFAELRENWLHAFVLGLLNSAVPFSLLSFSVLYLSAGFAGIVNASAPLWGGLIAIIWLGYKLNISRVVGLVGGFGGVVVLIWGEVSLELEAATYALPASLLGAFSYGLAANYAKKYTAHMSPVTVAAGSLAGAAIFLLPWAIWLWPEDPISFRAWASLLFMAVVCTAWANIVYFRLIGSSGPTMAISVAYLIPVFAIIFGVVFLDESVTLQMVGGCVVILLGTALVTNVIRIGRS